MPLETLSKSYEAYEKSFQAFLDHSTARQSIVKCIQDGTKRALTEISDKNRPFRILGIGSGKGEMDVLMIHSVAAHLKANGTEKKPAIHSVVVEPSSFLLEKFKESASSMPASLTALAEVSFEWRQMTFQEYQHLIADDKSKPRQDFIHFIHSIYYMDAEDALQSCFEKYLGEKGAILCLVQTEASFFAKVQRKFKGKLTFGSEDITVYTKEDLATIAARSTGWSYDEITQEFSIDITKCFGEPSEESDLLLDFLTHQKNFRVTADQALKDEVMNFFRESMVTDESGGKYLKAEMAAVVINK